MSDSPDLFSLHALAIILIGRRLKASGRVPTFRSSHGPAVSSSVMGTLSGLVSRLQSFPKSVLFMKKKENERHPIKYIEIDFFFVLKL